MGARQARVVEADGLLSAHELAERVCAAFGCPYHEHLSLAEQVAYLVMIGHDPATENLPSASPRSGAHCGS